MDTIPLVQSLLEKYDLISSQTIKAGEKIKKLVDSTENKCRFCDKVKQKKEFSNKAHLIPEFLGNKTLFASFECNECNSYFGKIETELANFMLPYNSVVGTRGKKGPPHYKKSGEIEIFSTENRNISIQNYPKQLNLSDKQFDIPVTHDYIPNHVYKTLVKIGVSILDEEHIKYVKHIISWLLNKEQSTIFTPLMLFTIYPFEFDQQCIRTVVLKKKNTPENIPTYILSLSYKNFSFQTYLPEKSTHSNLKNYFPFPCYIPNELDTYINNVDEKKVNSLDLSSKERKKTKSTIQITNLDN